ncbi:hypothetical protein BRO54_3568 [Geobacillus proteiniphilus]|uniref:Uncharacterized protein n=1 Tax=Geobacillus proteiniphilus TaxID=860353 RepID=A0A1Q5SL52_9BACL|nr:hypothetical protein BRO54_3568 [Geobacillus proteiniphilus]
MKMGILQEIRADESMYAYKERRETAKKNGHHSSYFGSKMISKE